MTRYVKGLSDNIVESFRQEVLYLQGDICRDSYKVRRLRWMSLHTVLGHLAARYDLPDIHRLCGFDADALARYKID